MGFDFGYLRLVFVPVDADGHLAKDLNICVTADKAYFASRVTTEKGSVFGLLILPKSMFVSFISITAAMYNLHLCSGCIKTLEEGAITSIVDYHEVDMTPIPSPF
jgi:hypothetical protein